jgi:hypothetical protein
VEPAETAVAKERLCIQKPVTRQWLGDRHVIAATVAHATIAELYSMRFAPFSVRSVRELCGNAVWANQESLQSAAGV